MEFRTSKLPDGAVADYFENMSFLISVGYSSYNATVLLQGDGTKKRDKSATGIAKAAKLLLPDLQDGLSLSSALSKKQQFGNISSQVAAAERAGKSSESLNHIAKTLRSDSNVKKQIRDALGIPIATLVLIVVSTIFLFTAIIPPIFDNMAEIGVLDLPQITVVIMSAVDFLNDCWLVIVILSLLTIACMALLMRGPLKLYAHRFYSKSPVIGQIVVANNLASFYNSLNYMLFSNCALDEAIDVAASGLGNLFIKPQLEIACNAYRATGSDIYKTLSYVDAFSELELQTLDVGYQANQFCNVLEQLERRRRIDLDRLLKRAIASIEPTMAIFMGIIFGVIAIAVYTPLMNMTITG